ncbi:MAG: dockerin type I domain-containing protein, partial [Candidatus Hinthialibacter sp.]
MRVISRSVLPLQNLWAVAPIIFLTVFFSHTPLAGWAQEEQPPQVSLDLNGNGAIDPHDVYIFMTFWKKNDAAADFNSDGVVDSFDLLLFREAYHSSIAAPTPTPTPEEATPTPTPEEGEATPTPTLDIVVPTPTPTLEEEPTPTSTPEEADTPTPTPTEGPAPTPTEEPTPTPTVDPGATPTPTPAGLFFYTNFDTIESFEETGLSALDDTSEERLILEDRMPDTNRVISWILLNTEDLDPVYDYGVALSNPKSAAVNEDHFIYNSAQTSVLELQNPIDTSQALAPMLSFEAAFLFEKPETYIADFLVVEASR